MVKRGPGEADGGTWRGGAWLAERNVTSPVPDLNPLDFSIWGVFQESVQGTLHSKMESVKAHIAEAWDTQDEAFIASAYRSMPCQRPKAVINANGQWRSHESEVTEDQLLWGHVDRGSSIPMDRPCIHFADCLYLTHFPCEF